MDVMIDAYSKQEEGRRAPRRQAKPRLNLAEGKPFFTPWRLAFLFVLILSIAAYLPSLRGLKIWDDDALLDGSGIGGGASVLDALVKPFMGAYFRPLVSLTFYFENKLWYGLPFYYHQTNILLHMVTCAALMGFVLAAFGRRRLAVLSGLLFAIQPVQVSAVAWIGGRTDSLCALLVILFAYTLLLAVRAGGIKRNLWLAASVTAFFLAALTKEQVLALIILVPYAFKIFDTRGEKLKFGQYAAILAPYVLMSALFVALWITYNPNPYKAWIRTPIDQVATGSQTAVFYALSFLAPSGKWMHTLSLGALQAAGWPVVLAGLAILAACAFGLWKLSNVNPKLAWVAWLSALALLPVMNLVPLPSLLVAPYRAGVCGLGIAVLLAWLLLRYLKVTAVAVAGGAFILWCSWLTVWGCFQWRDPVAFFSRVAKEDPYSIIARRNYSAYLLRVGNNPESITQMKTLLDMLYGSSVWQDPQAAYQAFKSDKGLAERVHENQGNEVKPESWLGDIFAQLGFADGDLHYFADSRKAFETSKLIDPANTRARVGLAQFAMFDGNAAEALRNVRIAIAVHPSDPALYRMEAKIYDWQGKLDKAEQAYDRSIAIEPWFGPAYQGLAEVQVKRGNVPEAIETLKAGLNCRVLDADSMNARIEQLEQLQNKAAVHAL